MREVLDLQQQWQAKANDAMERRGALVKYEMRDWLTEHTEALADALGVPVDDVLVEGKDAAGSKAQIPWVRVASRRRSPSATMNWYIVYLFSADGERVYLSLMQHTSRWADGNSTLRSRDSLKRGRDWARPLLGPEAEERQDLQSAIELRARTALGKIYEPGTVVAIEYQRKAMPGPDVLRKDVLFMARLLSRVYKAADEAEYVPGDIPPEVREATESAARAAGRRTTRGSGQGFVRTADERQAIENQSVLLATEYFEAQGWHVQDVGTKQPYDLHLTRGKETLRVEVKGTTSDGSEVIVTRGEVEAQRKFAPHNACVVVHSITLDRTAGTVTASGGDLHITSPWVIKDESLSVISYTHRTGL